MQSLFRSAITVCLVKEAAQGPFVFHGDLRQSCIEAKTIGFDAIELFPPDAQTVSPSELASVLKETIFPWQRLAAVLVGFEASFR